MTENKRIFAEINILDLTKTLGIIFFVLFVLYYAHSFIASMNESNRIIQERILQISDNAIMHQGIQADDTKVEELKKKFAEEKSEILKQFEEEKKKTGEMLDEIGQLKAEVKRTRTLQVASDKIYNKQGKDPKTWYFFKQITVKNKDGKEVPVAWAMFYPYQDADKQWKFGTYELTVDAKVIESQNQDGTFNRYGEVNVFAKDHEEIPSKLTSIDWAKVEQNEKRMYWFNPRIGLYSGISDEISMGLDLSIASYGRTKRDMDFRFVTIGAGMAKDNNGDKFIIHLEPISWNIGNVLPLVDNLFVGPFLSYDFKTDMKYGVKISIPF